MRRQSIYECSLDRAARIYLSASYLYYIRNVSMMQDEVFDKLCKHLLEHYDELSDERKASISKGDLEAGTCLKSYDEYPTYTRCASEFWINWDENVKYIDGSSIGNFDGDKIEWHT